jgi:mRNA-degrading endonuclease RelE of RelBE toxin-antitoxin system
MNPRTTTHFDRAYAKAPKKIRDAFQKQALILAENLRHPSLHAKKYNEGEDLWQARVTLNWRFYFRIQEDTYVLQDIIPHPKK